MKYRYVGKTGLRVSELCLGAMTFGREADEATSFEMMDMFAEAGGNFIDTADVYTRGASETIVGNWLKNQRREDYIIATKVRFAMGDDVNNIGLSRKHIMDGVHQSLERLQVDYIDLYQVHCWDPETPLQETLSTLNQLVEQGKVRYIGVSNFKAHQIQKAVDISKAMGWEAFVCLQPLYNLLDRYIEWEIVELCQQEGIGIIPWSPLRGGWLTGKYNREMAGSIPEDMRLHKASEQGWSEMWENYANEKTWGIIDTLAEIAQEEDKSIPQVALNWVKDQPGVTAPIIGSRKPEQIKDNLGCVGWSLSDEQRERLNAASEPFLPYPYSFVNRLGYINR